ncbi:MAG: aspartate-semialdehyde dehydrogenase [Thermoplasmata archaeon]|nr:aspartate-semialdehyde dehydrogenase [Thermoplasmata archaeon]
MGASGYIGQHFARRLARHPAFADPLLLAGDRSVGRRLDDVWALDVPVPPELADRRFVARTPRQLQAARVNLAFGALPSGHAGPLESELLQRGIAVFTNAADHRRDAGVPLLVPEVNADHLRVLGGRDSRRPPLVANPNCTATGLVLALAPVWDLLAPAAVHVTTYQARSGAGIPGLGAAELSANVIPHIAGEEEKVAVETAVLLGKRRGRRVVPSAVPILVHAARVPTRDGHLEAVTVVARRAPSESSLRRAWTEFDPLARLPLPTAPHPPIQLATEDDRPQPALDVWAGTPASARGMAAVVGRIRWSAPHLRFFVLTHNAVRGGAGGSVLNAELALAAGDLRPRGTG